MRNWFQFKPLCFTKCSLYRLHPGALYHDTEAFRLAVARYTRVWMPALAELSSSSSFLSFSLKEGLHQFDAADAVGLYKLNPVDPQLESAWLQPSSL